ncbi:MAG: hypothetical protein ACYTG0_16960, partial [Planctomycetota bacterium]
MNVKRSHALVLLITIFILCGIGYLVYQMEPSGVVFGWSVFILMGVAFFVAMILDARSKATFSQESEQPRPSQQGGHRSFDESYIRSRNEVLQLRTSENGPGILAVLMETGDADGVETLATLSDGTTHLLSSGGMSLIGFGSEQEDRVPDARVRTAAKELLQLAADSVKDMPDTSDFPTPSSGQVRF